MEMLYFVVWTTVSLAIICVIYSTWTTVGDLKSIVADAEARRPHTNDGGSHDWHELASRAIGHIEHLHNDDFTVLRAGGMLL